MLEQLQKGPIPQKRKFKVQFKPQGQFLTLSSMFDSGNIGKVQIGQNNSILITPAVDCAQTQHQSHSKGWFYFSVSSTSKSTKLKIIICKMTQFSAPIKISQYFKPVYRYEKQEWKRVQNTLTITKQDDTQLHIQFQFTKNATVYFAFSYPFSYEDCERYLQKLSYQIKKHKDIYYKDEILIKSPMQRNIHLLTISSKDGKLQQEENIQDEYIFPVKDTKKSCKFQSRKKVILVTARVHPAEVPSSHTFNGIIKFLTSQKDVRAYYLRKNFVFKLVPMLNPDGVSNGHHRMDIYNQNLNRFYLNPDPLLQPSSYSIRKLGQYLSSSNRLCFYLDLHAHPQRKGNFIYGNSFSPNFQKQSQTQLFPKILSLNCIQFDYFSCSFEQKHMTHKDKNQPLSKQGCGRVVFQKHFDQIYSYTLECGYTCSNGLNQIVAIDKAHRKIQKHGIVMDQFDTLKSGYYSAGSKVLNFTIESYQALGKAVCVSILDVFGLNTSSRIPNTIFKNIQAIRKELYWQVSKGSGYNKNIRIYNLKSSTQSQGQRARSIVNSTKTTLRKQMKQIHSKNQIQSKKVQISSQKSFADGNFIKIQSKTFSPSKGQHIINLSLPKVGQFMQTKHIAPIVRQKLMQLKSNIVKKQQN